MSDTWKSFASNTTLHGFRYIVTTSGIRRLIWLTCLLTSCGWALYILYDGLYTYISLPVNTVLSSETPDDGMEFPDITICNLNVFVKSKVEIGYNDTRFRKLNLDLPACDVIRNISGNLTCGQALLCAYKPMAIYIIPDCNLTMATKLQKALIKFPRIFNPEAFLLSYGNDFTKMLVPYCRFGPSIYSQDKPCIAQDFDQVLTSYGVCYTFNVTKFCNRTGSLFSRVRVTGADNGLSLILNAQLNEILYGDWSSGFRIMASQRGRFMDTDEGFIVSPGTQTLVALRAHKVRCELAWQ